ncbi:hypothetical protein CYMTET_36716 [Cymbomonas tetramitiformis]|uniref:Uncharacterized protein n=1 Tax=Cymbomonas tetramitiformis TaxID=36881 RepID=A0AAE0CGX6_9CHLO|nr:hypothetical protein CYMTET_36716 [Cymbomonas tetramitiformis]
MYDILRNFLRCKRRQQMGTGDCFLVPVWSGDPTYELVSGMREVFCPVRRYFADELMEELEAAVGSYQDMRYAKHTKRAYDTGFFIVLALQGVRRAWDRPSKPVMPITLEDLRRMSKDVDRCTVTGKALWAAILAGFYGLFRKDNLTAGKVHAWNARGALLREDILFSETGETVCIRVRHSKTIQCGERYHWVPLVAVPGSDLRPVEALRVYMLVTVEMRDDDQLFQTKGKSKRGGLVPMTHAALVACISFPCPLPSLVALGVCRSISFVEPLSKEVAVQKDILAVHADFLTRGQVDKWNWKHPAFVPCNCCVTCQLWLPRDPPEGSVYPKLTLQHYNGCRDGWHFRVLDLCGECAGELWTEQSEAVWFPIGRGGHFQLRNAIFGWRARRGGTQSAPVLPVSPPRAGSMQVGGDVGVESGGEGGGEADGSGTTVEADHEAADAGGEARHDVGIREAAGRFGGVAGGFGGPDRRSGGTGGSGAEAGRRSEAERRVVPGGGSLGGAEDHGDEASTQGAGLGSGGCGRLARHSGRIAGGEPGRRVRQRVSRGRGDHGGAYRADRGGGGGGSSAGLRGRGDAGGTDPPAGRDLPATSLREVAKFSMGKKEKWAWSECEKVITEIRVAAARQAADLARVKPPAMQVEAYAFKEVVDRFPECERRACGLEDLPESEGVRVRHFWAYIELVVRRLAVIQGGLEGRPGVEPVEFGAAWLQQAIRAGNKKRTSKKKVKSLKVEDSEDEEGEWKAAKERFAHLRTATEEELQRALDGTLSLKDIVRPSGEREFSSSVAVCPAGGPLKGLDMRVRRLKDEFDESTAGWRLDPKKGPVADEKVQHCRTWEEWDKAFTRLMCAAPEGALDLLAGYRKWMRVMAVDFAWDPPRKFHDHLLARVVIDPTVTFELGSFSALWDLYRREKGLKDKGSSSGGGRRNQRGRPQERGQWLPVGEAFTDHAGGGGEAGRGGATDLRWRRRRRAGRG